MPYTVNIMVRSNERGPGREPSRWRDPKFILGGTAAVLGAIGGIVYMNSGRSSDTSTARSKIEMAQAEKRDTCGALMRTREKLPRYAPNRARILERLAVLGKCTDPNAIEFNFGSVCTQIKDGIRSAQPIWLHPVLRSFYVLLYAELKCAEKENRGDPKQALDDLFKTLDSSDITAKFRLLDPARSVDEICKVGLAFIKESSADIRTVGKYVLGNEARLPAGSRLKGIVEGTRAAFRKKNGGKEPALQDLESNLDARLGIISAVASVPGLCLLPVQRILERFDNTLTEEELSEKRRLALPLIRELLEMLKDQPDTEETRETTNAMLNMARRMGEASSK